MSATDLLYNEKTVLSGRGLILFRSIEGNKVVLLRTPVFYCTIVHYESTVQGCFHFDPICT